MAMACVQRLVTWVPRYVAPLPAASPSYPRIAMNAALALLGRSGRVIRYLPRCARAVASSAAPAPTRARAHSRPRCAMHVYTPPVPKGTVLFVHGGAWMAGHGWQYAAMGRALACRGYAAALASYSTYPRDDIPAMVVEVAAAVRSRHGQYGLALSHAAAAPATTG